MRRLPIILFLASLTLLTVSHAQGTTGHVQGEVWYRPFVETDNQFDNLHLGGCEIAFRSGSFQKRVTTNAEGRYEADLPPGTYSAATTCTMTPDHWEYHSAARADFEVKPASSALINLMVLVKRTMRKQGTAGAEQPEYRREDLGREMLEAKSASGPRKILVRYTRRLSSKELAEYQGMRDYRQDSPVSATFDVLAIYADSITVEKPAMHLRAVGHVVVEDGKQRRQGNEATVEFDAADPMATLKILGASSSDR